MKSLMISIAILFCLLSMANDAMSGPADITAAAKAGLPTFLARIPAGSMQEYGFNNNDSLDKACLGDPFNLHVITPDALFSYSEGVPVASILTVIDQWYFPVMIQDQIRCFLIVDRMEGKWEAVSLGYAALAKFMNQVETEYPAEKGFSPTLIAVFQAKTYLVMIPESGNILLQLPPTMTASASGKTVPGSGQIADILESLKPTVVEAIKQQ
jgi:hypothetical protein